MAKKREPSASTPRPRSRKPKELSPRPSPRSRPRGRGATPRVAGEQALIRKFATGAARLLRDSHCEDVLVFDVRGLSDLSDYIVLALGTSERQIRSVGQEVEDLAKIRLSRFGRDEDGSAS